jgi:hypothetical protein
MDLLVEKLDGSRYYLSQYKVLITEFEESAPSVTRNSKQLDQRNGNIDFGGWHTDKTINITGYYRAGDMDEEEMLRERLYALLSDPDGYYITQLKTTPNVAMERPGETSGGYYDKLSDYPSHKRFLVYTEAPEMELVGNVNGTLLYKLTAEFKTMKLPYGETPPADIAIDNTPYKDVPVNLVTGSGGTFTGWSRYTSIAHWFVDAMAFAPNASSYVLAAQSFTDNSNSTVYTFSFLAKADTAGDKAHCELFGSVGASDFTLTTSWQTFTAKLTYTTARRVYVGAAKGNKGSIYIARPKLEIGTTASPWSPNPADPEYYSLAGNVSVPYSGSVPCNQLEQQFSIELTAMGAASSLSLKIDDTELTYSGGVASGDVFLLNGFSYTQNGLSIVSKTNKAYFVLQPDKPNRITCNVPGKVRILGFQNLYA